MLEIPCVRWEYALYICSCLWRLQMAVNSECKWSNWHQFIDNKQFSDRVLVIVELDVPVRAMEVTDLVHNQNKRPPVDQTVCTISDNRLASTSSIHSLPEGGEQLFCSHQLSCASTQETHSKCPVFIKETRKPIHSVLFCARSQFFKQLLISSHMKETEQQEVQLVLSRGETDSFLTLCNLIYFDTTCLNRVQSFDDFFLELFLMADRFLCDAVLEVLTEKASSMIPESIESLNNLVAIIKVLQSSRKCTEVLEKVRDEYFLQRVSPVDNRYVEDIVAKFSFQTLLDFLNLDLISYCEESLMTLVFLWLQEHGKNHPNISEMIERILGKICAGALKYSYLAKMISLKNEIFSKWHGFTEWYASALEQSILGGTGTRRYQSYRNDSSFQVLSFVQAPDVDDKLVFADPCEESHLYLCYGLAGNFSVCNVNVPSIFRTETLPSNFLSFKTVQMLDDSNHPEARNISIVLTVEGSNYGTNTGSLDEHGVLTFRTRYNLSSLTSSISKAVKVRIFKVSF